MENEVLQQMQNWLESEDKDFLFGFALFEQASKNLSVKNFIFRRKDLAKLEYEMRKLLPAVPPVKVVKAKVEVLPKKASIHREQLPEILQVPFDENTLRYKELRTAHEKMKLATTDPERAGYYAEIKALDEKINAYWKIMDAYVQDPADSEATAKAIQNAIGTNTLPQTGMEATAKEINAAKVYLSRGLKALSEGKVPENKQAAAKQKMQERVSLLLKSGHQFDGETLDILKQLDILV